MLLETKRLILREFHVEDFEAVHKYAYDPEVCRYSEWGPNSNADTQAFIESVIEQQSQNPREKFTFAVVIRDSNVLIGACNLTIAECLQGEIGYSLNHDYWGRGFATEAAKAVLVFAFNELNLHRVYATCRPSNIGSSRVLEKIGMQKEGYLRDERFYKGQWHDSVLYAIIRSDIDFAVDV